MGKFWLPGNPHQPSRPDANPPPDATVVQERWMRLIELLNSDEFGYPCSWFEDADGNRLLWMANRTVAAQYVKTNAHRMRIDAQTWVRGDEWIYEDIEGICRGLQAYPEY